MNHYRFFVPALPVAQPRPRATAIGGHARLYEAAKDHPIHGFKQAVVAAWRALGKPKATGPVKIALVFVFPRKKFPKRCGTDRQFKPSKPDWDNLGKGFCDALNGWAWQDDAQIVSSHVEKFYAAVGEEPGVYAMVWLKKAE